MGDQKLDVTEYPKVGPVLEPGGFGIDSKTRDLISFCLRESNLRVNCLPRDDAIASSRGNCVNCVIVAVNLEDSRIYRFSTNYAI